MARSSAAAAGESAGEDGDTAGQSSGSAAAEGARRTFSVQDAVGAASTAEACAADSSVFSLLLRRFADTCCRQPVVRCFSISFTRNRISLIKLCINVD